MINKLSKIALALAIVGVSGIAQAGFLAEIEANDTIGTAQDVTSGVTSGGAPADVGGDPWVSIAGTGNDTYDYYSFSVAAGSTITFDIDNAYDFGHDLELFLYDLGGNLLASNDDGGSPDADGSTGSGGLGFDPYISHLFASAGTYVIGVCAFNCFGDPGGVTGSPVAAGMFYDLNISGDGLAGPAPASEPTILALFGLGLAGLGFIGRRRRS